MIGWRDIQRMVDQEHPDKVRPNTAMKYLNTRGIRYYLDRKGRPWTMPECVAAPLIGRTKTKAPNFAAITEHRDTGGGILVPQAGRRQA